MLIVRPVKETDIDVIIGLAELAGPGFTSLAVGDDVLRDRVKKSVKSFSSDEKISPAHTYMLVLEDTDTKTVIGLSAIKAQIGISDPFFNFRVLKIAQKSSVTNRRFDMEMLVLVNEFTGATEVGSLFVKGGYRGTGAGRLIAQSRYMLIAANTERFGETVVSELRGCVSDKGHSPFWDAIGRKFFRMDFSEADHISAEKDNQFILDLMPTYPIYSALLPDEAQAVIGQTHKDGIGARKLLEQEGFRYDGLIDIFDGGPSVSVPRDDLLTVKNSVRYPVRVGKIDGENIALISNDQFRDFRCLSSAFYIDGETLVLPSASLEALGAEESAVLRVQVR